MNYSLDVSIQLRPHGCQRLQHTRTQEVGAALMTLPVTLFSSVVQLKPYTLKPLHQLEGKEKHIRLLTWPMHPDFTTYYFPFFHQLLICPPSPLTHLLQTRSIPPMS